MPQRVVSDRSQLQHSGELTSDDAYYTVLYHQTRDRSFATHHYQYQKMAGANRSDNAYYIIENPTDRKSNTP